VSLLFSELANVHTLIIITMLDEERDKNMMFHSIVDTQSQQKIKCGKILFAPIIIEVI
jgi:hypothetical protein